MYHFSNTEVSAEIDVIRMLMIELRSKIRSGSFTTLDMIQYKEAVDAYNLLMATLVRST